MVVASSSALILLSLKICNALVISPISFLVSAGIDVVVTPAASPFIDDKTSLNDLLIERVIKKKKSNANSVVSR